MVCMGCQKRIVDGVIVGRGNQMWHQPCRPVSSSFPPPPSESKLVRRQSKYPKQITKPDPWYRVLWIKLTSWIK